MKKGKEAVKIPGILGKKEKELRESFLLQVSNLPNGESIKKCIQCGTCPAPVLLQRPQLNISPTNKYLLK